MACFLLAAVPAEALEVVGHTRTATEAYPEVVRLHDTHGRLCTGTYVLPDVVLTAAHCVDHAEAGDVVARDEVGARRSTELVVHPRFAFESDDPATPTDIAFVVLERRWRSPGPSPRALRTEALHPGERVTFVGYGGSSPPVKREGRDVYMPGNASSPSGVENRVAERQRMLGRLYFEGAPADDGPLGLGASASKGDSGAAIFGEDGDIAGLVVAVSRVEGHRVTWASDATAPKVRPFLEATLERLARRAYAALSPLRLFRPRT